MRKLQAIAIAVSVFCSWLPLFAQQKPTNPIPSLERHTFKQGDKWLKRANLITTQLLVAGKSLSTTDTAML